MNAVVEISGKQFKVSKDTKLYVHRLDAKEGSKVSFGNVLLLDNGKKLMVGTPNVQGASVEAKVLKHLKDDKVIVFKKKRRKGYRVKNGHRQALTEIVIEKVSEKTVKPKVVKKAVESKVDKPKKAAPKAKTKK
ncbi:MAG: 50S ribosomal protein L21 [Flavobacteriales bacterium]|nr:50S ribosomal protein L21 [Flavobacteriales bacterium]